MDLLGFDQFCNMEKVTVSCTIDVIAMYQRDGNEASNEQYKQSLSTLSSLSGTKGIGTAVSGFNAKRKKQFVSDDSDDEKCESMNEYETPGYLEEDFNGKNQIEWMDNGNEAVL